MIKLKQVGKNLNIVINNDSPQTISIPEETVLNTLYKYAYMYNSKPSEYVLKQFKKLLPVKVKEQNKAVIAKRIETKIINKLDLPEIRNGKLKGFNFELPKSFIRICSEFRDRKESYQHLINFIKLLNLNPIVAIREKLFDYVVDNKLQITPLGYIVGARQVYLVKSSDENNKLKEFVDSQYIKIKGQKKSPKNYFVDELTLSLSKDSDKPSVFDLYFKLQNIQTKAIYTDAHTRRMRWSLNEICEIPRSYGNTEKSCGSEMLHIGSNPRDLSGYGDTNWLVLVNPQDVISCVEKWKFGVCKFYPFMIVKSNEDITDIFHTVGGNFDYDYAKIEFSEVDKTLKTTATPVINFKGEIPLNKTEKIDWEKIIRERTQLI